MNYKPIFLLFFIILITSTALAWYTDDPANLKATTLRIYSDFPNAVCQPTGECTTLIKVENISSVPQAFVLDILFPKDKAVQVTSVKEQVLTIVTKQRTITKGCTVQTVTITDLNSQKHDEYLCKESGQQYTTSTGLAYTITEDYNDLVTSYQTVTTKTVSTTPTNNTSLYDSAKYAVTKELDYSSTTIEPGESKIIKIDFKVPKASKGEFLLTTNKTNSFLDPWWDLSWDYKQLIALNTDAIGMTANVTRDHPILIDINSANTSFWAHVDSNGNDIRFTNNAENASYSYHFNDWDYVGQRARIWVKVTDTFNSTTDTNLYIYYGNAAATASSNQAATYDGNFEAVYHAEDGTVALPDSTGNHAPASRSGTITTETGKIGNAVKGGGAGGIYNLDWNWNGATKFSIMFWIKEDLAVATGSLFGYYGGAGDRFMIYQDTTRTDLDFENGSVTNAYTTSDTSTSVYSQIIYTYDGADVNVFFNGKQEARYAMSGNVVSSGNYYLLARNGALDYSPAYLDEFRFIKSYALTRNDVNLLYASENQSAGFVTFGAEQAQTASADFNITFNVYPFGSTSHLSNFNIDCNDNAYDGNFNSPKSISFVNGNYACKFTRTGYDLNGNGTSTYLVEADANKTYTIYLRDLDINGSLRVKVRDENSAQDLTGVTMNLNGTNFTINTSNTIDLNYLATTTTNYTITFTKTGYGTRYYQFDGNRKTDLDLNFLLLPITLGSNISFTVYSPDQNTLETNKYFQLNRLDRNSWIAGRLKTNSSATTTLFTNVFDQNYSELIGDTNTYNQVALSVLYPKNEITQAQISETWKISITQNLFAFYTDLAATKIVYLLPNTTSTYNLVIDDMNVAYASRTYSKSYRGNPLTDTLQPFLIPTTSALATVIYTKNSINNQPVTGVNVDIYKPTSGGFTLLAQLVTDTAGQALATMIQGEDYYFDIYSGSTYYYTKERKQSINQAVYFYLDLGGGSGGYVEPGQVYVNFSPSYSNLSTLSVDQTIRLSTTCTGGLATTRFDINVFQYNNRGVLVHTLYGFTTTVDQCGLTKNLVIPTDINITDYNYPITIYVKAVSGIDFNFSKNYFVQKPSGGYDIFAGLRNVKLDMGCSTNPNIPCGTSLIIIAFIMLFSMGFIAFRFGVGSKIGVIALVEIAFFTWITWIPMGAGLLIGVLGAIILIAMNYKGIDF